MRTSRLARQTAQVMEALSPRKRINGLINGLKPSKEEQSTDDGIGTSIDSPSSPSRKRKRESTSQAATPDAKTTTTTTTTVTTRTTQRNAGATDKPKKARRQPAKQIKDEDGQVRVEAPPNWEEIYQLTKQMRSQILAPVDTMGCESLAEDSRSPRDRRFQTLIALMLSSQTKDTVTSAAIKNLQENLPDGLTLESILKVEPPTLNELITKVGFHNNKTKFIKATALILEEKHGSDIPDTIEGLVALPGVGPKMAYLCMSAAWGRDEGIGVDVHVHRITNLWGWHKTKTPEETRAALESWLPKEKWHDINHLLVGFGQTWCPPVGRKCDQCGLAEKGLCPSAVLGRTVKRKVVKREVKIEDGAGDENVTEEVKMELELKPIKAEQLEEECSVLLGGEPMQDIEDIGQARRRSGRAKA